MQSKGDFLRAVKLLPPNLRDLALKTPMIVAEKAEEIRLRAGKQMTIVLGSEEIEVAERHAVTNNELQIVLEIATRASAHSYTDSIKNGYVTAEGGCRIGLCGTAVAEDEIVSGLRRISSICIRIPHEKIGCATEFYPELIKNGFESTIIISPPGAGKTTLLRELVRLLSDRGSRISLVDERNEVAGSFEGHSYFDVGRSTDILSCAPKSAGVMMVLRSMAPQVIAFDEITAPSDIEAAVLAANCGIQLLTTAHAASIDEMKRRPLYRKMFEESIFQRAVVIKNNRGKRSYTVEEIK